MTDHAQNMGLIALIIDGVTHGLAVDGKTFVFLSEGFVPAVQGSVQFYGIDADQDIADNRLTWDDVTFLDTTAAEALPGIVAEAFGPIGDGSISAHPTEAGTGHNGQNRGESMPATLGSARVGDFGKEGRQRLHLLSIKHHFGTSSMVGGLENRLAQQPSGISLQRFDEDLFGERSRRGVSIAGSTKASGLTHVEPVGRLINGPLETLGVHKGLQQYHGMSKSFLPICIKAALAQGQNA